MNNLSCAVLDAQKLVHFRLSKRNACNSVWFCRFGMHVAFYCFIVCVFLCNCSIRLSSSIVGGIGRKPIRRGDSDQIQCDCTTTMSYHVN